jgi:hypothetical protein
MKKMKVDFVFLLLLLKFLNIWIIRSLKIYRFKIVVLDHDFLCFDTKISKLKFFLHATINRLDKWML